MDKCGVVVVGASGRLGRAACGWIEASPEFELRARFGRGDPWPTLLTATQAELALDVTVAGLGFQHGQHFLSAGLRPIVGTSGVSLEQTQALDRMARELGLGGIVVPNFSLGAVLMQRFAVEAARHLPEVEIIEQHHHDKPDAPSGTALDTARRIAEVRGQTDAPGGHGPARGQRVAGIPIHSVRLHGRLAHQEVLFGAPGELLSVRHDTLGLEAFAPGLLAALRYARRASGVARGLEAALA